MDILEVLDSALHNDKLKTSKDNIIYADYFDEFLARKKVLFGATCELNIAYF